MNKIRILKKRENRKTERNMEDFFNVIVITTVLSIVFLCTIIIFRWLI
jgi:hypothetical protein